MTTEPLRALSVKQPWTECIALGEKTTENRSWPTSHRGILAIHAGKRADEAALDDYRVQRQLCGRTGGDCWDRGIVTDQPWQANRGVIVAVAHLVECHAAWQEVTCCQPWGDRDSYHWSLDRVQRLPRPVPCRGMLGLFRLPDDVAAAVRGQIQEMSR